jgi:carotenoid cleavage dioxygenase-like enzyme
LSQDISIELPTINQKYIGHNYKYAYGIALPFTDPTPGKFYDRIKKIDLENQQYIIWNEPHCYPSQPVFVQNPSKVGEEDEGVILSFVYDGSKDESFLLILNAKDMTEITRIVSPVAVSPSFSHAVAKVN